MAQPFPSPTVPADSTADVIVCYLDYFRSAVTERLVGLDEQTLRTSALPSGWTPIELLKHLTAMERRWFVWGFAGEAVGDPWSDNRDGRWHVDPSEELAALLAEFHAGGTRTSEIIRTHDLAETGQPGDRWDGAPPATLERICLHVLQEYARHAGHLDIVSELAGGPTGE